MLKISFGLKEWKRKKSINFSKHITNIESISHTYLLNFRSVYKGIGMKMVSSIPVSDNFASKINSMNSSSPNFIPAAVTTEYFKKNKFHLKDVFGKSLKMQKSKCSPNTVERGKKWYYGDDRLSYMDKAIDLSQPDYKRFRLGKNGSQVVTKFSKRNYSIDPPKKGVFTSLKHPYEWNIKDKPLVKYSMMQTTQRDSSPKVNNSSFDNKVYKENLKKNNPINHGKEIAARLKYMNKEELNNSAFMNTKYLKNFSTFGGNGSPIKTVYKRNPILYDPKSMTDFYKNNVVKKRDISPKVGQSFSVSSCNSSF